jgi:hypothetical protein
MSLKTYFGETCILLNSNQHIEKCTSSETPIFQLVLEKRRKPVVDAAFDGVIGLQLEQILKQRIPNNRNELIRQINFLQLLNEFCHVLNFFQCD